MRKYGALLMAGVTGCANVGYDDVDLYYEQNRQSLQAEIYSALFNDSDNDSISDYWDQCQKTPLNVKVSLHGCPLDTNGNGKPDYQEEIFGGLSDISIPEPAEEPRLESPDLDQNCFLVDQTRFVSRFYGFTYDSDQLTQEISQEVAGLIATINADQTIIALEIVGHTDDRGSIEYNLDLSERRANMLATEIRKTLRSDVEILVSGKGEFDPMASNASAEGRALNRRVEFQALYLRQY